MVIKGGLYGGDKVVKRSEKVVIRWVIRQL